MVPSKDPKYRERCNWLQIGQRKDSCEETREKQETHINLSITAYCSPIPTDTRMVCSRFSRPVALAITMACP